MLRLYDAGRGLAAAVRPVRPGELRIWIAGGDASPAGQAADLRACLAADLVGRVAERHNLRASTWHLAPAAGPAGHDSRAEQALRTAWGELNIHPAEFSARPPDRLDVAVIQAGQPGGPAGHAAGHRMQPGAVRPAAPDLAGLDPLALRLAFLEHRYREPVLLTREALEAADQAVRHWRGQVAGWARSPSKPMCARYTGDVLGAFDDDLDTPSALSTLSTLATDSQIPPGSKFETFAYLDRLLGLDLASEVGR